MITLHYDPSNASMAPHMLLETLGVPYTLQLVDRTRNAHKDPEYLKLNPNGLIPVSIERPARSLPRLGPYLQRVLAHAGGAAGVRTRGLAATVDLKRH